MATVCAADGCPETVARGYCPAHRPKPRRSPSSRVTGTGRWRVLKRRVLYRDGYACHYCGGRADTADHVIPVTERPDLAFDDANVVASCTPCNLRKGARATP